MKNLTRAAVFAALALTFGCIGAAEPAAPADRDGAAEATAVPSLPAGTPVVLEILDTISSDSARRGDRFRLRLAKPILVGGVAVLPAGLEGQGEIIHAEPARAGGKAGELLLAARHLDHDGRSIALRGMKLGGGGTSQVNAAIAVAIVTGPFGLLVRGGNIEVPGGTRAQAKLAEALDPASPVPASSSTPAGDAAEEDPPHSTDTPSDVHNPQE